MTSDIVLEAVDCLQEEEPISEISKTAISDRLITCHNMIFFVFSKSCLLQS